MFSPSDTIIAPASALGGGVAVIRVSGPLCALVAESLGADWDNFTPRLSTLKTLKIQGEPLDHALLLRFDQPHSFTGEDVFEIHTHGSPAVVSRLLAHACTLPGVRLATAGEFTRRAVHHGKMDLTQAEGLADLIAATTAAQQRQALAQLNGALGDRFEDWRQDIMRLLAQVEAGIDFPDEELEVLQDEGLTKGLHQTLAGLNAAVAERAGERVREGLRLAIIGEPNAGKSTLLNLLAGQDVAIVSDIAGTTRDVVTRQVDIGGYPVLLADTAGLRETKNKIEAEGIRRAHKQAEQADVLVAVISGEDRPGIPPMVGAVLAKANPAHTLVLVSKADLAKNLDLPAQAMVGNQLFTSLAADLTDRSAFPRIEAALTKILQQVAPISSDAATLTRARHRQSVAQAIEALGRALLLIQRAGGNQQTSTSELVAEELRQAAHAIGSVTGRTTSEDVLDVVFSTFCIGK